MNKEEFWKTIESVNHSVPDGNHEMVAKQMCEELLRYSPQDILDWHLILREYTNAAYRNDLWAACTALGAHSSDDGFIDFRTWLISQGKDIYMDAMRDPDTLAANPHAGNEMNFEAFSACAIDAYVDSALYLSQMDEIEHKLRELRKLRRRLLETAGEDRQIRETERRCKRRLSLRHSSSLPGQRVRRSDRSPLAHLRLLHCITTGFKIKKNTTGGTGRGGDHHRQGSQPPGTRIPSSGTVHGDLLSGKGCPLYRGQ